jgi:hypothetical protein
MFFEYEDDDEDDSSDRPAAPPAPFFSEIPNGDAPSTEGRTHGFFATRRDQQFSIWRIPVGVGVAIGIGVVENPWEFDTDPDTDYRQRS